MVTFSVSSEADVVEVVRAARESDRTMEIIGHDTKRGFGRPVECDDVLDLSGLSGIVNYEPDEMIVTARAGTPVVEIEAALAEHNQRLGFEPADWGPLYGAPANAATIGGVVSASCDGSAAIRYGRCRDHLLGFRAVNGLGEAYKAGGKVVKNVTGFDVPKLMCGAMGTLGPLTEVTLRAFPKPSTSILLAIGGLEFEAGLALLRRVWSSPSEATTLSLLPWAIARHFPKLPDIGGGMVEGCFALVRLDGSPAALSEKHALLQAICEGGQITKLADCDSLIVMLNSGPPFIDTLDDVWLVQVPPDAASEVIVNVDGDWIVDSGGARIWIGETPGIASEWQSLARKLGGSAVLLRASEQTRMRVSPFAPEDRVRAELTQRVKAAFDPLRLFNPGRMWEGV